MGKEGGRSEKRESSMENNKQGEEKVERD